MKEQRKDNRRYAGTLVIGTLGGVLLTLAALGTTGMLVPWNLRGPAFQKFESAYEAIYQNYYQPVTSNQLLNGAVQGLVDSLNDPFSDYFPPAGETQFQNTLSNSYVGIGIVVEQQSQNLVIQSVIQSSPAAKAGLKSGDQIIAVDGKLIQGLTTDKAVALIQGPAGKPVTLTVIRPDESTKSVTFTVTRARITAPEVYPKLLKNHVGYVRFSIVGQNSAQEFQAAVDGLKKQGATRLIIDLRGNPGGYLDQALRIANFLIPKDKVVVEVQPRSGPPQLNKSTGPGLHMPIAVLMDRGTASAAEILSAALHDDVGAPLIGTRSYGKGTAQTSDTYFDGSGMKYTIAKWLTPTGKWINRVGLQPTVKVELPSFALLPNLDVKSLPLMENQVSSSVQTLQAMLKALGYGPDRLDGYFDSSTALMVKKFQSTNHLTVTGVVNQQTASVLEVDLNRLISQSDTQLTMAEKIILSRTSANSVEK